MRLSFTTIHDIPDELAQEYIDMLRHHGLPLLDPNIVKNGTQTITAEGEFHKIGESDKSIKIPMITIIEAGTLQ